MDNTVTLLPLAVVLQEENKTASPAAIICAQHQDLEKASIEVGVEIGWGEFKRTLDRKRPHKYREYNMESSFLGLQVHPEQTGFSFKLSHFLWPNNKLFSASSWVQGLINPIH